ncbi:MAG: hypothetical protein PWR29_947, partial [Methanolobus sp.]|nr:hypothetical protein [Methanolobus sp.]
MVSFEHPEMFGLIIPVLIGGAYMLRKARQKGLIVSRMIVLTLLIIALASPYTLSPRVTVDDSPNLVLIADETDSMGLFDRQASTNLYEHLAANTPTTLVTLSGDKTALGDAIMQYATGDNQILMVTDGNSNSGADLEDALKFAQEIGTTVYYVQPDLISNDITAQITGDKTVIVNNKNLFYIVISQADNEEIRYNYELYIDDEIAQSASNVIQTEKQRKIVIQSPRTEFKTLGKHTLKLVVTPLSDDSDAINNVFYKSVYVIPKPKIVLVTTEPNSELANNLKELYSVTTVNRISDVNKIDQQKAIVLDNIHALSITEEETSKLREYVTNGGGLYVIGGNKAFNYGNYLNSSIESLLPVISKPSKSTGGEYVVLILDFSGSTLRGGEGQVEVSSRVNNTAPTWPLIVQSAKNILSSEQFKDATVGIIPMGHGEKSMPNTMLELVVPQNMDLLNESLDSIIVNDPLKATDLNSALIKAQEMLETSSDAAASSKTIIIIADGVDELDQCYNNPAYINTAKEVVNQGYNVKYIHIKSSYVGQTNPNGAYKAEEFMRNIGAHEGYISGIDLVKDINENFIDAEIPEEEEQSENITNFAVFEYNANHPITRNLNVSGSITGYNDITQKPGSERVLVTATGKSILTTWRYGLGRVAALSTDNGKALGWSNDLFYNTKNLTSSTVNWAIGNPREETGAVVEAEDTWYGTPANVVLTMYDTGTPILKLNGNNVDLSLTGNNVYEASVSPGSIGVHDLSGYPIAVNYA